MQNNMQNNTQGIIKIRIKKCKICMIRKTIRKEYADNMQIRGIRKQVRKKYALKYAKYARYAPKKAKKYADYLQNIQNTQINMHKIRM